MEMTIADIVSRMKEFEAPPWSEIDTQALLVEPILRHLFDWPTERHSRVRRADRSVGRTNRHKPFDLELWRADNTLAVVMEVKPFTGPKASPTNGLGFKLEDQDGLQQLKLRRRRVNSAMEQIQRDARALVRGAERHRAVASRVELAIVTTGRIWAVFGMADLVAATDDAGLERSVKVAGDLLMFPDHTLPSLHAVLSRSTVDPQ